MPVAIGKDIQGFNYPSQDELYASEACAVYHRSRPPGYGVSDMPCIDLLVTKRQTDHELVSNFESHALSRIGRVPLNIYAFNRMPFIFIIGKVYIMTMRESSSMLLSSVIIDSTLSLN